MDAKDKWEQQLREYPRTEQECYPKQPEAMFDIVKLSLAWEYYSAKCRYGVKRLKERYPTIIEFQRYKLIK